MKNTVLQATFEIQFAIIKLLIYLCMFMSEEKALKSHRLPSL